MSISDFVILTADKSHCPECNRVVSLIQDRQIRESKPSFYICWVCERIFEVGKGEVKSE